MKIEKDKGGYHEVVSAHAMTPEGRICVPSSTGTTRGAQLGRDHTVAQPSKIIGPDGDMGMVTPKTHTEGVDDKTVSVVPSGVVTEPVPTPTEALESAVVHPSSQVASQGVLTDRPSTVPAETGTKPPKVTVTVKTAEGVKPPMRWRGRYHEALVSETCVTLVWHSKFEYSDAPLLPFEIPYGDSGEGVIPVTLQVGLVGSKSDDVRIFNAVYCDLSFKHKDMEYFVFLKQ